jgi:FMN phosphatase YigB (HAD superfamily)
VTAPRLDAVLFDAGGVLIIPDPIAIGNVLERFVGPLPVHRFHRAHHTGLYALELPSIESRSTTIEHLDWATYRAAYVSSLGVADTSVPDAVEAIARIWSPLIWHHRIEENVAALWHLQRAGVPVGVVSNASGQVEAMLAHEGVCQVGRGAGVPVACVIDSHVANVAKPDPAIFAPALAALGDPEPSRVGYIGDSYINDVGGALAAGLVPLHLDPFDDYAAFGHERIASVHDVLAFV